MPCKKSSGICRQQKPRSACISMQSDQGLHCMLTESLGSKGADDTCAGWSEPVHLHMFKRYFLLKWPNYHHNYCLIPEVWGQCYLFWLFRLYGLSLRLCTCMLSILAALYLLLPGGSSGFNDMVKSFSDFSIFFNFISIAWIFASVLK